MCSAKKCLLQLTPFSETFSVSDRKLVLLEGFSFAYGMFWCVRGKNIS